MLVVSAELGSKARNPREPESAALLGDGAAAAIVEATPEDEASELLGWRMTTWPKGAELSANALDELDAVGRIYSFIAENIKYDYDKANSVKSGYAPNVDDTLTQKKGICFDYAALMATMLRTQGIPTRLEVGYAGTAYHAWISTHISEIGWVNGIIQFDGQNWTLMDPTMAAAKGEKNVVDYIGDGSNYQTKYIY